VDVRLDQLVAHCRAVNPGVLVLPLSVTTGEGMQAWRDWLRASEPPPAGAANGLLDTVRV
jgi:hydrogenase nickel incorporation protein HypB